MVFNEILVLVFVYKRTKARCEVDVGKFAIFPFQFEIRINGEVKNIQVSGGGISRNLCKESRKRTTKDPHLAILQADYVQGGGTQDTQQPRLQLMCR